MNGNGVSKEAVIGGILAMGVVLLCVCAFLFSSLEAKQSNTDSRLDVLESKSVPSSGNATLPVKNALEKAGFSNCGSCFLEPNREISCRCSRTIIQGNESGVYDFRVFCLPLETNESKLVCRGDAYSEFELK